MKPQQFEQYRFYRLYSIDLNTVRHSLRLLKRYRRQNVRTLILRDIMVGYARPFSKNVGRLIKKHGLNANCVPSQLRSLHDDIIEARNQMLVHTDFDFRNPRVAKWSSAKGSIYPMSFRSDDMERFDKRVEQIEDLVKAVESNVNAKIMEFEMKFMAQESMAQQ